MSASSRYQHILQALPSGVVILDAKGRVAEANPVASAMLGTPLLGESWLSVINRCFQPRSDDGLEVSLTDGRRLSIAISPLGNEPGQLLVLTDLTETRQLQQRLHQHQRLSTLGKMMATLAHQIRTPLSSAMLYAENLGHVRLNPQQQQQFQQKLVLRLRELEQQVNDMLLFARSGSAQAVQPLSLQQLGEQLQERSEMLLAPYQASLRIDYPDQPLCLIANPQSLIEALQNLLQNSVQAAGQGAQIRLRCQALSEEKLILHFSDNGPGIPPAQCSQIFEPFVTFKTGGSGLGLAVVRAVLQTHQGSIDYVPLATRSPQDLTGACFALTLPLSPVRILANLPQETADV